MVTRNYFYTASPRGDHRYMVDSTWSTDCPDYIAEDAAEDFHSNRDGWENKWPIVFAIFDGNNCLGQFSVEREYEPTFSADRIDDVSVNTSQPVENENSPPSKAENAIWPFSDIVT